MSSTNEIGGVGRFARWPWPLEAPTSKGATNLLLLLLLPYPSQKSTWKQQ